ncbi:MAG: acyl-CoA/acyl-ACP dehydrogenase [Planctomycetota bacterium]|nr:acyl-CoA/acyl-ACP dehydrogenase [Planctomycetota bacterium]MDA1178103.1 acyl-CoA/acyl-ACP dehydrogenase [Planctomycetota bacterium]
MPANPDPKIAIPLPADATDAVSLILKQAGRTADEVASLSSLDDADRSAESQFSGEPPTVTSLFGHVKAVEFDAGEFRPAADVAQTMASCLTMLLQRKQAGTLLDHAKMLFHDETLAQLAQLGFFGLAIPKRYGGSGAKLGDLGPLLRALTFVHPDLAVMFEVHNFLGPVTPILDFGTEQQKNEYLPRMARGELLGSFALTEPGAGADPSQLSLTARRNGEKYLVSGVKWPITNVLYGGICVLVLKLEGHNLPPGRDSGMLIFEVPQHDTIHFRMVRNRLKAFDYLWNARFRLTNFEIPTDNLLGPPGKGLAQAFSSLAKGRGGICVNSSAKIFRLLAQVIVDPSAPNDKNIGTQQTARGGWTAFRTTFGKRIGDSSRIQSWIGRATTHALASRALGDLCFRLGANGVRDETLGMIAKVFATKALLQTAIHAYQIQGGRSVHTDERREAMRHPHDPTNANSEAAIENYIGENIHEFLIASVYEGPNPVLADVGGPNAMTRGIRSRYLEPIGLANIQGKVGLSSMAKFAWFVLRTMVGSLHPWPGSLVGVSNLFPAKRRLVWRALHRNRVLGRRILLTIARHQKSFIDQHFQLGDEGGIFDQLSCTVATLAYTMSLDKPDDDYGLVAHALDLESELRLRGLTSSPKLQTTWALIGQQMLDPQSRLYADLIADIEVSDIPLDPRFVERFI